ncbi:hypothetical protein D1872_286630 [compost metagenome]
MRRLGQRKNVLTATMNWTVIALLVCIWMRMRARKSRKPLQKRLMTIWAGMRRGCTTFLFRIPCRDCRKRGQTLELIRIVYSRHWMDRRKYQNVHNAGSICCLQAHRR